MSLGHFENRRDPTVFGEDLNVLIDDTFINGNLDIQGNINGTSSQGQNLNNTWTGTNEWSVLRPTCIPTTGTGSSGVNVSQQQTSILADSIVNKGATWTGANTFLLPITVPTTAPVVSTRGASVKYVLDTWNIKSNSYLNTNNTWSLSNTFVNTLPICIAPVGNTDVATKAYTQTAISAVASGPSTTVIDQTDLTNVDWGATALAVEVQIVSGGGGATEGISSGSTSAGVAGGSGMTVSLFVLTSSVAGTSQGQWSIGVGLGGSRGNGCGTAAAAGNGGPSNLFVTPKSGSGLNQTQVNIIRANGGQGSTSSCGESGIAQGGVYSSINPKVVYPWGIVNGTDGRQANTSRRPLGGVNTYGYGGDSGYSGGASGNNTAGFQGGYGLVNFLP